MPADRSQLLQSLQLSKSASAGKAIIGAVPALTPQVKSAAIGTLLSRPEWAKSLLVAAESRTFDLAELSLEQKQALRAFPDEKLRARAEQLLSMAGGLPDANRDKVLKSLLHLTEQKGDVILRVEIVSVESPATLQGEIVVDCGVNGHARDVRIPYYAWIRPSE